MSAVLKLQPDPDLLFLEWRQEAACMLHSMGLAHQLGHVSKAEWRAEFDRGGTVPDAVIRLADRLE